MLVWASVLLLAGAVHFQGHSRSQIFATAQDSSVLRPINLRDYESAIGLRRRTEEDFSDLDPSAQSQLIYGRPGDNGQLLLANMTLYAPDGLPIILMERFEGLTSAVDCKGDDGAMSLTFRSGDAYMYALKTWQYINEDDNKQFLLIANHDGCGPSDQRQPYKVSIVKEDAAILTISMRTTIATWSEVAGSYDLDFGKAALHQTAQRVRSRSFWGDIVNVGKDALEAAQGNADLSKSVNFAVNVGKSGQSTNIYSDSQGRFSIDCIDCYITGSWGIQGHLVVKGFALQDLTLEAAPQDFKAKLELEATATASKEPVSIQSSKELFSAPIPGAGITVAGIFKLGATVSYEVGISATFAGTATADFGLTASLPNGAKVVADVNSPMDSSATGWQGSSLTPNFEVTKLSASITLAAFSQAKLALGIELTDVGNVDVAVTMKLPEISLALSADYDSKGLCSQDAGASKTGVKLENKADESLSLQIDVKLGDGNPKPSWSQQLLGFSQPLGSSCIPLPIAGLEGACRTTPTASPLSNTGSGDTPTTCKPPGKTGIRQDTSKSCAGGTYISGYCPGDNSIRCCPDASTSAPSPTTCKPPGKNGVCQSTSSSCAGGAYISGYCPGDASIQCCPSADSSPKACAPPGKTGICQDTTTACAGGAYISGYCPGDNSIKCCPNASPTPTGGGGGCKIRRDRFGKRMIAC